MSTGARGSAGGSTGGASTLDRRIDELDDPSDFASGEFRSLDASVRCQICHEFLTAPVMLTTCSHTFDSLCLRNHLREVKKCPQCSVEANEDRIRRNLALEQVVNLWQQSRALLLSLEKQVASTRARGVPTSKRTLETRGSSPSPTTSRKRIKTEAQSSITLSDDDDDNDDSNDGGGSGKIDGVTTKEKRDEVDTKGHDMIEGEASSDVEVIEGPDAVPKPPRPSKKADLNPKISHGKGKAKVVSADLPVVEADPKDPSILVTCPVCQKLVKNAAVSRHLDSNCVNFVMNADPGVATRRSTRGGGGKKGAGKAPPPPQDAFGKLMGHHSMSSGGGGTGTSASSSSLSRTTAASTGKPAPVALRDTTKYLPLPNYAHKKLKEIETLLKSIDLPITTPSSATTNDHKVQYLKKRHSQFLTLWNSNCDLDVDDARHKSVDELKDDLRQWEKVLLQQERQRERDESDKVKAKTRSTKSTAPGANKSVLSPSATTKRDQASSDFGELIALARASYLKDKEKRMAQTERERPPLAEDRFEPPERQPGAHGDRREEGEDLTPGKGLSIDDGNREAEAQSEPKVLEEHERRVDELGDEPTSRGAANATASSLEDAIEAEREDQDGHGEGEGSESAGRGRARTVRILTPPRPPSPSPSPSPSSSPCRAEPTELVQPDDARNEDGDRGGRRRERSSSILSYDEKFFPPTSQRVREVDWDMVRKAREEAEAEEEEEEDESN